MDIYSPGRIETFSRFFASLERSTAHHRALLLLLEMFNSDCFTATGDSNGPGPPADLLLEGSFPDLERVLVRCQQTLVIAPPFDERKASRFAGGVCQRKHNILGRKDSIAPPTAGCPLVSGAPPPFAAFRGRKASLSTATSYTRRPR
uniref:Uncharacterized protein n=1 Tax=Anopheles coluzzii TaxID=1518534 RepID=A0A8W7PLJ6_ANOCL